MKKRKETTGDRLKAYATSRCGSVAGLATELEMRTDNLQKYVADKHAMGAGLLLKIGQHGCNLHWLVCGEGEMYPQTTEGSSLRESDLEMLTLLRKAGVTDPLKLKAVLSALQEVLKAQEKLRKGLEKE